MLITKLDGISKDTEMLSSFGGIDRNTVISENCFSEMKNMSSLHFPMISPRPGRGALSFEGVHALCVCNTYGTRDDIADGTVHEDVFALVTENENGEAQLELKNADGTDARGTYYLGGNAEETTLISQAGYIYAFPQARRIATYTGDSGPLSLTTVTRRVHETDADGLRGNAYFEMRPCDSEGIADGEAVDGAVATKIYDGTDPTMTRDTGDLIICRSSGLSVNGYGTTVKIDATGKVIARYYGTAEIIEIPDGGYALTGINAPGNWLSNTCTIGRYVAVNGKSISVFETKDNSVVYEKPDTPFNGLKWYDKATGAKYVYSAAQGRWVAHTLNYILLRYNENSSVCDKEYVFDVLYNGESKQEQDGSELRSPFEGFKEGDCVKITGFSEEQDGSYTVAALRNGGLVLNGVIFDTVTKQLSEVDDDSYSKAVTISRTVPKMDYVIECNNRLWGCYYGIGEDGKVINEIYASALGDPTNWRRYQGISTDSWTATVGADGPFTGAIQYGGYPLFFKENAIIRVYGSAPSSFQIASYNYRGVAKGSHRSLSICNEVLYYLSLDGVMAYSGSVPQKVSAALGNENYCNGAAGALGNRYYLSCTDSKGNDHLFVFDAALGLWHREDELSVSQFFRHKTTLYMLSDGEVLTAFGGDDDAVEFECVTGEWGLSNPYRKHFSNFIIRAIVPLEAYLSVYVSYDGGEWASAGTILGKGMTTAQRRIAAPRCDRMRLKLSGQGAVRILSIYREIADGGRDVY